MMFGLVFLIPVFCIAGANAKLLQKGLSIQEVAEILEVDVETIRQSLRK